MFLMKYFLLLVIEAMIYFEHWFENFGSPNKGLREQDVNPRYLLFVRFNL